MNIKPLILILAIFALSMPIVSAAWWNNTRNLSIGLVGYWKMNNGSINTSGEPDEIGNYNLYTGGVIGSQAGKLNNMRGAFTSATNVFNYTGTNLNMTADSNYTMGCWIYATDVTTTQVMWHFTRTYAAGDANMDVYVTSGNLHVETGLKTGGNDNIDTGTMKVGWTLLTVAVGTNVTLYVNATSVGTVVHDQTGGISVNKLWVGKRDDGYQASGMSYDECFYYNRGLNVTEIQDLWNNGAGLDYNITVPTADTSPPTLALQYPTNLMGIVTSTLPFPVNLNYTATDSSGVSQCWYDIGAG